MKHDSLAHIILDPFDRKRHAARPTLAQLRELEAAVEESLAALDSELPWEPIDDVPPLEAGALRRRR